jgi:hypothetical protein
MVTAKEIRFVALFALALVLVTSIPYLVGHFLAFPLSEFNGNLVYDADFNAYFAFMRQSAAGQWLFHNPFTPEPHRAAFFNLEWLFFGKLAAVSGISLEAAVQVQRVISAFMFCFAFYWLSSFLFTTVLMRRLLLTMVMLGGGFGWIFRLPMLGPWLPSHFFRDVYPGFQPFFWIFAQPHFLISQCIAVLALCLFLHAENSRSGRYYIGAALCGVVVASIRPFDALHLMAAVALYTLIVTLTRKDERSFSPIALRLTVVLAPIPLMVYYVWLLRIHPVFRWWSIQNVLPPPKPTSLVAILGVAAIMLVCGLGNFRSFWKKPAPQILIICCFLSSLTLLYSFPALKFSLQMGTTIVMPTILVGVMNLEAGLTSLVRRSKWAAVGVAAVLLLNSLSSLLLIKDYTKATLKGEHRTDARLLAAYSWLDAHSEPREIVLPSSSYPVGNEIPRYTHNTVFCGYHFNTVLFREKDEMLRNFFRAETGDSFRYDFLREFGIRYVFLRLHGSRTYVTYDPGRTPFLKEIFRNDSAAIYEFVP